MEYNIDPSILTLTTDFGLKDEYVGLMKGVILDINSEARVVDLSHSVTPQNLIWPNYLIYYSFRYFPKGTIHVVVVDPGVGTEREIICVKAEGHIFLSPDNGVLTKVLNEVSIQGIRKVENEEYFLSQVSDTFHGRDIFAPVAAHLSTGRSYTSVGPEVTEEIEKIDLPQVQKVSKGLKGEVIHIDRFGNIVTNIEKEMIEELNIASEDVKVQLTGREIKGIKNSYQQVNKGGLLSIVGSRGLLEISANKENASRILEVRQGTPVEVILE